MEQYIPKSALVAEIDKRLHQLTDAAFDSMIGRNLIEIRDSIDTLEVKEVDLEKELNDYIYTHDGRKRLALELDWKCCNLTLKGGDEIIKFAKHFFELGLKAQHSSIGIPNIDDIFEEEGIDPNSKDAKIFKECYYMALEKLEAQKGEQ